MSLLIKKISLAFILCSFLIVLHPAYATELKSNVIILMDFSNSYFTKSRIESVIPKNIKKISQVLAKHGPKRPALIQVAPINSVSQTGRPICEFLLLRKKLIGGRNKKNKCAPFEENLCSSKSTYFKDYMNEQCMRMISKTPEENNTDISGALSLASQIGNSQTDKPKYLVIFSDMFEYRRSEIPITKVSLKGFHILVVCGGDINQESDGLKFCAGTEATWGPTFKKMGAESINYVIETGNWDLKTARDFFKNG